MENFGNWVCVILIFIILGLAIVQIVNFGADIFVRGLCRKEHDTSKCVIIYVPHTETELLNTYSFNKEYMKDDVSDQ